MNATHLTAAVNAAPASGVFAWMLELLGVLVPLGLVVAGLFLVLRLARKRYGLEEAGPQALRVSQVIALGPRQRLVVLKAGDGTRFVVGVGTESVTYITGLSPEQRQPDDNMTEA